MISTGRGEEGSKQGSSDPLWCIGFIWEVLGGASQEEPQERGLLCCSPDHRGAGPRGGITLCVVLPRAPKAQLPGSGSSVPKTLWLCSSTAVPVVQAEPEFMHALIVPAVKWQR